MVIYEILEQSQTKRVKVFFDMDGVCVEYKSGEGEAIRSNEPNLYLNKRPIKSVLNIMKKLAQVENVDVGILSNCHYREQKNDKIQWLKNYAPFIKPEDINIITLSEEVYNESTKDSIKGNYLKKKYGNSDVAIYLIEDDHGIIRATNKVFSEVKTNHVSTLIM